MDAEQEIWVLRDSFKKQLDTSSPQISKSEEKKVSAKKSKPFKALRKIAKFSLKPSDAKTRELYFGRVEDENFDVPADYSDMERTYCTSSSGYGSCTLVECSQQSTGNHSNIVNDDDEFDLRIDYKSKLQLNSRCLNVDRKSSRCSKNSIDSKEDKKLITFPQHINVTSHFNSDFDLNNYGRSTTPLFINNSLRQRIVESKSNFCASKNSIRSLNEHDTSFNPKCNLAKVDDNRFSPYNAASKTCYQECRSYGVNRNSPKIVRRDVSSRMSTPSVDGTCQSEMYTNATGYNRFGRCRQNIPWRQMKENTLGSAFLMYGQQTKRTVLPDEVTALDTVKALFVRAFPSVLTMKYMNMPYVRIYVKDRQNDVFFELDDLGEIRDGCILKLTELKGEYPLEKPDIEEMRTSCILPLQSDESDQHTVHGCHTYTYTTETKNSSQSNRRLPGPYPRSTSEPRKCDRSGTKKNENESSNDRLSDFIDSLLNKKCASASTSVSTTHNRDMDSLEWTMQSGDSCRTSLISASSFGSHGKAAQPLPSLALFVARKKVISLKNELQALRRLHGVFKETLANQISKAESKIMTIATGYENYVRDKKIKADIALENYKSCMAEIGTELEELEETVEETYKDERSRKCRVSMNDVESFAFALSQISKLLVDAKVKYRVLSRKYDTACADEETNRFLNEQPETMNFCIKRCKRLASMLFTLKRLINSRKDAKPVLITVSDAPDKSALLADIRKIIPNEEARLKAAKTAERLRYQRLKYSCMLADIKNFKAHCNDNFSLLDHQDETSSPRSDSRNFSTGPIRKITKNVKMVGFSNQAFNLDKSNPIFKADNFISERAFATKHVSPAKNTSECKVDSSMKSESSRSSFDRNRYENQNFSKPSPASKSFITDL